MGSWGYAPRDGDSPHDMEDLLHSEATAPYLIKYFKKPLRKGSRKRIRPEVFEAELKAAGLKRPMPPKGKHRIYSRALSALRKKINRRINRRKNPDLFYVVYDASWDRWSRLGLVQILSEKRIGIPVSVVKNCRADLRELAKDEAFADSWQDPATFKRAVQVMLENVTAVLENDAERQGAKKATKGSRLRRRGPRLIYDAIFQPRKGERQWKGHPQLKPIPRRKRPQSPARRKGPGAKTMVF